MKSFNEKMAEYERLCDKLPGGPDEEISPKRPPSTDDETPLIDERKAWAGQE